MKNSKFIFARVRHMQFQIRRAAQGDAGVLAFIQTESWKAAFQNILAAGDLERLTSLDRAAAMYSRLLDENRGNGYIGELDGKPHSIAYWDKARDAEMAQYAEIICIHSLPAHWRMGFGSLMMDRLLADISKAGFHSVMLWVFTENVRARKFYEAKGFSATDRVKPAFGTTELCYVKDTGGAAQRT